MTTRIVIAISLLFGVALCINLNAQAGGDVADQIKQLQQESRDAQMKNDASWAQQHLADGFVAGNSWGDWQTKEDFIKYIIVCYRLLTSSISSPTSGCGESEQL